MAGYFGNPSGGFYSGLGMPGGGGANFGGMGGSPSAFTTPDISRMMDLALLLRMQNPGMQQGGAPQMPQAPPQPGGGGMNPNLMMAMLRGGAGQGGMPAGAAGAPPQGGLMGQNAAGISPMQALQYLAMLNRGGGMGGGGGGMFG